MSRSELRSSPRLPGGWLLFHAAAVLLLALVIAPQVFTVRDEANYVGAAEFLLRHGWADPTRSPVLHDGLVPWIVEKGGRTVPQHPLGVSALFAPFVLALGWRGAYVASAVFLLLGALFFRRLLLREGAPASFVWLWFLFPPLVLYSRTAMADVPSATLALVGVYYLGTRPGIVPNRWDLGWGITALGAAFLLRPTNALFIGPIAGLALLGALRRGDRGGSAMLLGVGGAFLGTQLALNAYFLGRPLSFSYDTTDMFAARYFGSTLGFYLLAWTIVLPGMLLAIVEMVRRHRWTETSVVLAGLLFYSAYNYVDRDPHPLLSFVRGQRFLLPFAAVLLVYYAALLARSPVWRPRFERMLAFAPAPALLLAATVAILQVRFQAPEAGARAWIYDRPDRSGSDAIVYNVDASEFVHGVFGDRRYFPVRSGGQFPAALESAASDGAPERILVVEADHRFRRGPRFLPDLRASGGWGEWQVRESFRAEGIEAVVLVRG